jgi:hypothetical protein
VRGFTFLVKAITLGFIIDIAYQTFHILSLITFPMKTESINETSQYYKEYDSIYIRDYNPPLSQKKHPHAQWLTVKEGIS